MAVYRPKSFVIFSDAKRKRFEKLAIAEDRYWNQLGGLHRAERAPHPLRYRIQKYIYQLARFTGRNWRDAGRGAKKSPFRHQFNSICN
jgi:hypothetical protein